jgi:EF hand
MPTNSTLKREKNLAIGETEAKRILLLMDKDKNGKVSKQEFMSFMEAEDRSVGRQQGWRAGREGTLARSLVQVHRAR